MRFIDLAAHGGCSKKAPADQVRELLCHVRGPLGFEPDDLPDWGRYTNGGVLMSTVDIVLPMTLSPVDFGKITVCHVLNDLYAGGGQPTFALCILGVPESMSASSDLVVDVMSAAVEQLSEEGASLVGGHTMCDQADFYLGFAAVGRPLQGGPFAQKCCVPGDLLILTKPLGTSIATLRWKFELSSEHDHADVLQGMLKSNRITADILSHYSVHACTDVTGYGFLGHLFNILHASGVGGRIQLESVPCYESLAALSYSYLSRQADNNKRYVAKHIIAPALTELQEALLFDSQVSGGLLFSASREDGMKILEECKVADVDARIVGEVISAPSGTIELVS